MTGRVLIYGATGFTGRLLAERARALGMDALLAGRNRQRVERLSQTTGLSGRTLALGDGSVLDAALADVDVVLNSAGPFDLTARPLVEACLRTGTHYLDVSGELPIFQQLHAYDHAARAAGVMVMPGAGFVVAASDCLAAHVAGRVPGARHLRLALSRTDLVSRGSFATMLGLVRERVSVRRDGLLCAVPVGTLERGFNYGHGDRVSSAASWADVFTAYYTTGIANIAVYLETDEWTRWFYQFGAYFARPINLPPMQKLMALQARVWPEGPSGERRAAAPRVIVAEAEDDFGRCVRARLHTPDGYSFTQLCALAIVERVFAGELRAGFQTPAGVYGADFILGIEGVRREDITETGASATLRHR